MPYRVCLDPGHGGHDPGAVGPTGLREKDVTLAVSELLAGMLARTGQVEVRLTRDHDQALGNSITEDLQTRCQIAAQWGADLFVSIHCNSSDSPSARGTETFCLAPGGERERLAGAIQSALIREIGLTNRGVKYANFYVLRNTSMPAALTELAFISNPEEEALLGDPGWQFRFAKAVFDGITQYLGIRVVDSMFNDIAGHWAEASIIRLAQLGLLKGDENGNFRPDEPLTRAQLAVVIDRLLKLLGK